MSQEVEGDLGAAGAVRNERGREPASVHVERGVPEWFIQGVCASHSALVGRLPECLHYEAALRMDPPHAPN